MVARRVNVGAVVLAENDLVEIPAGLVLLAGICEIMGMGGPHRHTLLIGISQIYQIKSVPVYQAVCHNDPPFSAAAELCLL
jgi:hypothetical protein